MAKKIGDNDISSLLEKYKELEVKYKKMEEKQEEMQEIYKDVRRSVESVMPEFRKCLEKLEHRTSSEFTDTDKNLSDHAQNAIQYSAGPLKPDMLFKFLMTEVYGKRRKKVLTSIKKYSSEIDGVKKQLSDILEDVEGHMEYRKNQEKKDIKFIKMIKFLNKKIETEKNQNMQPNHMKNRSNGRETRFSSSSNGIQRNVKGPGEVKDQMTAGEGKRNSRKRKEEIDTDSCSSQENEVRQITTRTKRLKLCSSESNSADSMSEESQEREMFRGDLKNVVKRTKSRKKRSRRSEEESGLGKDLSESSEEEQTVHQKSFSMSENTFRQN